jgi:hypothetical protein
MPTTTRPNKEQIEQLRGAVDQTVVTINSLKSRLDIALRRGGLTFDGKRDLRATFGYIPNPTYEDYIDEWSRFGLFWKAVDFPIKATWDRRLTIRPVGAKPNESPLEKEWVKLQKRLKLHTRMVMMDRMLAFSPYVVGLIGFRGSDDLEQPQETAKADDVLFLQPYFEKQVKVLQWDADTSSERFGKPHLYEIEMVVDPNSKGAGKKVKVHWSRVIHAADEVTDNPHTGTPRALRLLDRAQDALKVLGGTPEMWYQGADRVPVIEAVEGASKPGDDEIKEMLEHLNRALNGLKRSVYVGNAKVSTMDSITPDPTGVWNMIVSVIAATSGIPQRMLLGSERGELASDQDRENWSDFIDDRRSDLAEPTLLFPLVDRLMELRALPQADEYEGIWPEVARISQAKRAEHWSLRAEAMQKVSGGFPELLFTPEERRLAVGFPAMGGPDADAPPDSETLDESDITVINEFDRIMGRKRLPTRRDPAKTPPIHEPAKTLGAWTAGRERNGR